MRPLRTSKTSPVAWAIIAAVALTGWSLGACSSMTTKVQAKQDKSADTAIRAAVPAAEQWLKLVDAGEYAASWDAAASYFRDAVAKDTWVKQLKGARKPLGKVLSRKVKSTKYATSLPGAPDGQYVVIQFTTSFANKKDAVETVTPMKGKDGTWRVSGYFIK